MAAPETQSAPADEEDPKAPGDSRHDPEQESEQNLVARARRDDATAFQELFNRFYSMIYAFSYRSCLDAAAAQDVAQETFIKAARSLDAFRGGSFKAWLYRIAANTVRDWQRGRMREHRLAESLEQRGETEPATPKPDFTEVTEALQALPDELRLAIVLTFYEGMSHAGAANVLGCAETTVSWRVFRAKRKLKTLLSKKTGKELANLSDE